MGERFYTSTGARRCRDGRQCLYPDECDSMCERRYRAMRGRASGHCEHGIRPVTDCLVCVSPRTGEERGDG